MLKYHCSQFYNQLTIPIRLCLLTILIYPQTTIVNAFPGDELVVTGSIVNFRAIPSLQAKVLLRFAKGKELIEISRYQEWIEVSTKGEDARSGWVHSSVLESLETEDHGLQSEELAFSHFKSQFDELNESIHKEHGYVPFTRVERVSTREIQLTGSKDWFLITQQQRENILSDVFKLWLVNVEIGLSVSVEVVDSNNKQHMVMFN